MEASEFVSIGQISSKFSISKATLRRWDRQGSLKASFRTGGGHRRYSIRKVARALGVCSKRPVKKRIDVLYSRVSSAD